MESPQPRWPRLWRWTRRIVLTRVTVMTALVLVGLIFEYSQPTWELRVEGTPGATSIFA